MAAAAVTGLQRMVEKENLDRNTKMQVLIRAGRKVGIVDDALGEKLDAIRKTRNRIHIKTLDQPECSHYTAKMANDALDALELFRVGALKWTMNHRTQDAQTMTATLTAQVAQVAMPSTSDDWSLPVTSINSTSTYAVNDIVEHETLGSGTVTGVEPGGIVTVYFADGVLRRLMIAYSPMRKIGAASSDDDIKL